MPGQIVYVPGRGWTEVADPGVGGSATPPGLQSLGLDVPQTQRPAGREPELDSLIGALPEAAGLASMAVPGVGGLPNLIRLAMPAVGEGFRQLLQDGELSGEKLATRTAFNAAPRLVNKGVTAAAESVGGGWTRQSLARGMKAATPDATAALPMSADVSRVADLAVREGASMSQQDAGRFAQYANELRQIVSKRLNSTAQQAYLRARPEVAAALQRSGGDVNKAIQEFESLGGTLAKAEEGASRQGFNIPRFLAGGGVGGMVDYATGLPGVGTGIGLTLGAMEASMPAKFAIGSTLARRAPQVGPTVEAATRLGATGVAATTPQGQGQPARRQLRAR